jgi:general secretion pathway protein I
MVAIRSRHRQSGFTLIETVVAFAVLALALGVLYESFGWSLRRSSTVIHREAAWMAAQSVLAEIRGRDWLRVGKTTGVAGDGLEWQAEIKPHDLAIRQESPLRAFEVTIDVKWGERPQQQVRLQSVEVGRKAS